MTSTWSGGLLCLLLILQMACRAKGVFHVTVPAPPKVSMFQNVAQSMLEVSVPEDSTEAQSFIISMPPEAFQQKTSEGVVQKNCREILAVSSSDQTMVLNSSITISATAGGCLIAFVPNSNASGDFQFIASSITNPTDQFSIPVTITAVNDTPVVADISPVISGEDFPIVIAVPIVDDTPGLSCSQAILATADDQTLLPSSSISAGGTLPDCQITLTPVANQSGSTVLTVIINDGQLAVTKKISVSVTAINDPPTVSDVSNQTTNQETVLSGVSVSISDPDSTLTCNSLTASSSNTTLIPSGNVTISGVAPNCLISMSPAASKSGTANITLTVSDDLSLSASDSFVLTVTTVNSAPTGLSLSSLILAENSGSNAVVGNLSATDPDAPSTFTYTLVAGTGSTDNGSFNILGSQLRLTASADFETKSSYSILLRATDQGGLFFEKQFTITITNVNESPTDLALSSLSLAENSGSNAAVGNLSATDPDASNTFTYALVAGTGSTDNASFNILGSQLRLTASADFETKSSYSILLRATDQGGLFFEKPFTITITNVNESPTDLALSSLSLAENSGSNAAVGNLSATDPDASNTFTYSLVAGTGSTDNGSFNILGSQLRLTASADFETKSSYSILLRATDQGGLFFEKPFTITITNVNESPTDLALSSLSLAENSGSNAAVGNLSATDPDASNTFTYSLVAGTGSTDNGSFNILGSQLRLTASADFETKSSYSILLRATDQGGLFFEKPFTITITNVNETPTLAVIAPQTTLEDTAVTVALSPFDADGNLSCTSTNFLYSSSDPSVVAASGAVSWSGTWANCSAVITPVFNSSGSSSITITVTDGSLTASQIFNLAVTSVNDPPTISDVSNQTTNQDTVLSGVSVSILDPDSTLTCNSITASSSNTTLIPSGNVTISGVVPNCLIRMSPAASQSGTANITLTVSDDLSLSASDSFVLTVNHVNSAPTGLSLSSLSLAENSGANAVIGSLSATDPDIGDTYTYTLIAGTGSTDNASFNILGSQLRLTASADFETKSSYDLRIRVTDQGGLFFEKPFTITITNVNEDPTNLALSSLSLAENSGSNAVVGNLSATDPDASNTFTYTLVAGTGSTDNASFNILGSQLRMTASADFETKSSYSIVVRATDLGGLFFEKQFTITITNINETPSLSAISNQTTNQDTPTAAISLTVTDADGPAGTCNATYLSYTSQNTTVVASTGAINWAGTWPNCTAVITPVTGATGSSLLSISVSDGLLTSVPQSFSLQVGSKSLGWAQEAYLKASNANALDHFGDSVAISGDTVVVGAHNEDSNQTTITNGTTSSADDTAADSGASYIYKRTGTNWAQEAYLKASNANASDYFGYSVAISGDTAVIGAKGEDSNQTTITNGITASADNTAFDAGASYIYKRTGTNWAQEAYLKASNANVSDWFGYSVAISGDTAVIGAYLEASNQSTITNGTTSSADNSATSAGASYIYKRTGTTWAQEAYLKASNANASDYFGYSVAISGDTAVIGAKGEDSNQTTITNGTTSSADNSATSAGASYIYKRTGTTWAQEAYLKASNANASDLFGSVAISGDTAVIGAYLEASNQSTITNGTTSSADNTASYAGASYIYKRTGSTWFQEAYLKASNANVSDYFGSSVALSGDTAVVGALGEDSNQTTITNGATSSADNTAFDAGASYIYKRTGTNWAQEAYLKASNANASDWFGYPVAISGNTAVVGAYGEASNQTTITNGATSSMDNSIGSAGAVYVYRSLSRIFDPDLRVSAKTTNSITLSWGSNLGSASQVKIAPAVSGTGTPLPCTDASAITLAAGATTYTYSGLTTGTKYGFRVCAFDGTNVSEGSVIWEDTD